MLFRSGMIRSSVNLTGPISRRRKRSGRDIRSSVRLVLKLERGICVVGCWGLGSCLGTWQ